MKVRITYTIPGNTQPLEDILNWPDVSDKAQLPSLVAPYLDQKYGQGQYALVSIEVL